MPFLSGQEPGHVVSGCGGTGGPELSAVTPFECETTTLNKTHQTGENHSGHMFKHRSPFCREVGPEETPGVTRQLAWLQTAGPPSGWNTGDVQVKNPLMSSWWTLETDGGTSSLSGSWFLAKWTTDIRCRYLVSFRNY